MCRCFIPLKILTGVVLENAFGFQDGNVQKILEEFEPLIYFIRAVHNDFRFVFPFSYLGCYYHIAGVNSPSYVIEELRCGITVISIDGRSVCLTRRTRTESLKRWSLSTAKS